MHLHPEVVPFHPSLTHHSPPSSSRPPLSHRAPPRARALHSARVHAVDSHRGEGHGAQRERHLRKSEHQRRVVGRRLRRHEQPGSQAPQGPAAWVAARARPPAPAVAGRRTRASRAIQRQTGTAERARGATGTAQEKLADAGSTVRDKAGNLKNSLADALESGAEKLRQQAAGGGQMAGAAATGGSAGMVADQPNRMADSPTRSPAECRARRTGCATRISTA